MKVTTPPSSSPIKSPYADLYVFVPDMLDPTSGQFTMRPNPQRPLARLVSTVPKVRSPLKFTLQKNPSASKVVVEENVDDDDTAPPQRAQATTRRRPQISKLEQIKQEYEYMLEMGPTSLNFTDLSRLWSDFELELYYRWGDDFTLEGEILDLYSRITDSLNAEMAQLIADEHRAALFTSHGFVVALNCFIYAYDCTTNYEEYTGRQAPAGTDLCRRAHAVVLEIFDAIHTGSVVLTREDADNARDLAFIHFNWRSQDFLGNEDPLVTDMMNYLYQR